ncbi:MAG: HRDC domain-containing protein [Victivallales bacterium]|nr:HRDC domain-containing protein [Victivallales bacterium]MBT7299921.1 HRDC domain-containing protein [Victivallales bacterium]
MPFHVFTVAVGVPDACQELNAFLSSRRILSVQRELIQNGGGSCWTFCVEYLESRGASKGTRVRKERVDYKQALPPEQFEVFSRLRACRKELAARDGVPAFAVCTDEQLAAMAQAEDLTKAVFDGIDGFGEAKRTKYGEALIAAHAKAEEGQ